MSWTVERIDTLKKLWADGQSAAFIATKLGEVTRNAVIGKAHRLGLAGRATTSRRLRSSRTESPIPRRAHARRIRKSPSLLPAQSRTRNATAKSVLPELGPAPEIPVTVQTLTERVCHWPRGDPKIPGFHFCGPPKARASVPYCGAHAAIACR